MSKQAFQARSLLVFLLIVSILAGGCQVFSPPRTSTESPPPATEVQEATEQPKPTQQTAPTDQAAPGETPVPGQGGMGPIEANPLFAKFAEAAVNVSPSVKQEPVAPDFKNVYNPFVLSASQLERLARDGFVVTPGVEKEFFTVYEKARYANVPIFVTSDSLLHSYHLLFDKVLRTAETEHFIPLLKELNAAVLAQAEAQYEQLKGSPWEDAAMRVVAFVGVASKLLDSQVEIPAYAADLVSQELALVNEAGGIKKSPLFPDYEFGEDYTQYIPRGHYTRSEELKAYFRSMMWYGRMTFRLKTRDPEAGRRETRGALLLASALRDSQVNGRPALEAWADLYSPTVFFVGRSDDLTALQYLGVMDQIYGKDASVTAIADDSKLDQFIEAADQLPPPKILGMVIQDTDDETQQTKGMRFMGQRFVPDAYIFRQLIYRNVGTRDHRRGLPKGLDLLAAMGSERAYQILDEAGDTSYERYPEQMEKVRKWLSSLTVAEWTETLYNSWIYTFYPLIAPAGQGYPAFMQTEAWLDKQINTSLGSWAELKHDTILYAKQVYAEMGGGPPPPEPVPPKGYVEPVPEFYARLAALTAMTIEGLESRGLLAETDKASLQRLEELAQSFKAISEKELSQQALTQEEYDAIRFYGGELEHLVMASADKDAEDQFAQNVMDEEPQAAVVADVATDPDPDIDGIPNAAVLEEGVGRINEIHAVVPITREDGTTYLQIAKGGVFSYYEFPWPAEDRLTDEKWREMLDGGKAPALPEWTGSFMTPEGEFSDLHAAVQSFQDQLISLFWGVGYYLPEDYAEMQPFKADLEALRADKQYEGRLLVSANYLSYDRQSEDKAVVSVEEVWEDTRYAGEFPDTANPTVAHRGPYTLQVTYTLERRTEGGDSRWFVTGFSYADPPPEWEASG